MARASKADRLAESALSGFRTAVVNLTEAATLRSSEAGDKIIQATALRDRAVELEDEAAALIDAATEAQVQAARIANLIG